MENNRILVDTSIFIEFLRSSDKTKTELFNIPDDVVVVVLTVTIFELFAGAIDEQKWTDVKKLTEDLPVISFTEDVSKEAARIFQLLKKKNKIIEFRDIFIAATALKNKLSVKTLNKKHFKRIEGLEVL